MSDPMFLKTLEVAVMSGHVGLDHARSRPLCGCVTREYECSEEHHYVGNNVG